MLSSGRETSLQTFSRHFQELQAVSRVEKSQGSGMQAHGPFLCFLCFTEDIWHRDQFLLMPFFWILWRWWTCDSSVCLRKWSCGGCVDRSPFVQPMTFWEKSSSYTVRSMHSMWSWSWDCCTSSFSYIAHGLSTSDISTIHISKLSFRRMILETLNAHVGMKVLGAHRCSELKCSRRMSVPDFTVTIDCTLPILEDSHLFWCSQEWRWRINRWTLSIGFLKLFQNRAVRTMWLKHLRVLAQTQPGCISRMN